MSPGQTGRTPGGVPPKFFMFIGFFLSGFLESFFAVFGPEGLETPVDGRQRRKQRLTKFVSEFSALTARVRR